MKGNNRYRGLRRAESLLDALCLELGMNSDEAKLWFFTLGKLIPCTRHTQYTMAAAALALTLITHRYPPRKAVMLSLKSLARKGVKVHFGKVVRLLALLRSTHFLPRPSLTENIETVYKHLREAGIEVDAEVKQRVASLLEELRPRLGGRDPQLLVIGAFYLEAKKRISFYYLAKLFNRSPSRIRENIIFLRNLLYSIRKTKTETITSHADAAAGIRTRVLRRGRPAS